MKPWRERRKTRKIRKISKDPSMTIRGITLRFHTADEKKEISCEVWIKGKRVATYSAATPAELDLLIMGSHGSDLLGRPYIAPKRMEK